MSNRIALARGHFDGLTLIRLQPPFVVDRQEHCLKFELLGVIIRYVFINKDKYSAMVANSDVKKSKRRWWPMVVLPYDKAIGGKTSKKSTPLSISLKPSS